MRPQTEAPTVTPGTRLHDDSVETHPAYAQIAVSRVNGSTPLYGSDFLHHAYLVVRIRASSLTRMLAHDWPHPGREYIEVALSEAQWAHFVSTPNSGEGTQCTLQALNGVAVPQLPDPTDRVQQFSGEASRATEKAQLALATLLAKIEELPGVSQKNKQTLRDELFTAQRALNDSLPYVAKSFAEHVERTTEKAKIEVSAYVQQTIVRAGLGQLLGETQPFELPAGPELEKAEP